MTICNYCHRKVGLVGFPCRCNNVFCSQHRLPEQHNCSFDFKSSGRNLLAKQNPLVSGEKIKKI